MSVLDMNKQLLSHFKSSPSKCINVVGYFQRERNVRKTNHQTKFQQLWQPRGGGNSGNDAGRCGGESDIIVDNNGDVGDIHADGNVLIQKHMQDQISFHYLNI